MMVENEPWWVRAFEKGLFAQRIFVIVLLTVACYMWISGNSLPDELKNLLMMVAGFFFMSENMEAMRK